MSKPRILVPMSLQFSVRYLLRSGLLSQLHDFAEPVILLGWEDTVLEAELAQSGFEVHAMPKAQWEGEYERARVTMNHWHQTVRDSPSTAIRERRQDLDRPLGLRVRRAVKEKARDLTLALPGGSHRAQAREVATFWNNTNARAVERQVQQLKIDSVLSLTPFLVDEEMIVRVAALSGTPSIAAILSFDNLTTRPWIPVTFNSYLLWNRYNVEQLRRGYPQTADSETTIVGSPQFDFYWKPEYLWDEREWREKLELPADRPVLLFAGGFFTCAPHEPQFLGQLDDAIEANEIPGKPIILFRRHPVDPIERWQGVLQRARHVIVDNPWRLGPKVLGHTNIATEDIRKLASTLYHSSVHVNVASTMTIDGAIFDKCQVGPAYDDSPSRKYDRAALECYYQEHFLPITHSGGIAIARNRQDLVSSVRAGFLNPAQMKDGRRRIVEEICTFNDGRCAQRVARAVRDFVGSAAPAMTMAGPSTH